MPNPGEYIRGEHYSNAALKIEGLLIEYDAADETYGIVHYDDEGCHFTFDYIKEDDAEVLDDCPSKLRPLFNAPTRANAVFVLDWDDDGTRNTNAFREPQDVIDMLGGDLDEGETEKLKLQLMRSIADPGERYETAPGGVGVVYVVIA